MKQTKPRTYLEFFAGGGMARAGLGTGWSCVMANDFDAKKAASYARNWGAQELIVDDIRNLSPADMPGQNDLVWGSFPCQDLSLAGVGAGLRGGRSGTFWPFVSHVQALCDDNRAPAIIVLENVLGTLSAHKGQDFIAICKALKKLNYRFGALVADAVHFVPQSRPRLFIVAYNKNRCPPADHTRSAPIAPWHTKALCNAYDTLGKTLQKDWIWWALPQPPTREMRFADLVEDAPTSTRWHSKSETTALLSMMSEVNLAKVETAMASGVRMVGTIYKRTRHEHGIKVQRAEVRFDDIAGCLRTPAGGSSRQLIMTVEGKQVRSRLISTRETARLMGLPDNYALPERYNEAYHLTGDGVVVPVVAFLRQHLLDHLADVSQLSQKEPHP